MECRGSLCKAEEGEVKEGGSDSGVETNGAAGAASCDSSLVSCCSEEALRAALDEDSEGSSVSSGKPPRTPRGAHRPSPGQPHHHRQSSRGPTLCRSVSLRAAEPASAPAKKSPAPRSPLDDGRWPSNAAPRPKPARQDKKSCPMSSSLGPLEARERLSAGPTRRRRGSLEDLTCPPARPPPRELSLNRTASLRRRPRDPPAPAKTPSKPRPSRTRIFLEQCVQTALTGHDVESALAGSFSGTNPYTRIETSEQTVQVDLRIEAIERLQGQLKEVEDKMAMLTVENKDLERSRQELRSERDLRLASERRLRALIPDKFNDGEVVDCIEKHCNMKNEICLKQQQEIAKLQNMVMSLRRDLEKSFIKHRKMIEQHQEVEAESIEIQEFLQAEKSTLADTLKDLETEVDETKKTLAIKEAEISKHQEECSHLVRISEQRRQEKLAVEARLRALEANCKSVMIDQSNSISSASIALAGLGGKLDGLIDALVTSYNISQQDLEEVVFHNEAYSGSGSGSPESESPPIVSKPASQGFLANIFKALWTPSPKASSVVESISECEMLSAEPEPPAFSMQDATTASSKRLSIASIASLSDMSPRASIATSDDLETPSLKCEEEGGLANSQSLQNLSQAILLRQREEEGASEGFIMRNTSDNLVDQVIQIDNQVTKLLNIMHIVHNRKMECEKGRLSVEATTCVLKEEIAELNDKLLTCSKSTEQVEVLQKALNEKERELQDLEKKLELTQELLTSNWHKAMSEVKRQYEAIDAALEGLEGLNDDLKQNPAISRLQRELEESNFKCATSLPVSTSQPDLNANPTAKTVNGKV